jgi:hypothetical protein
MQIKEVVQELLLLAALMDFRIMSSGMHPDTRYSVSAHVTAPSR